MQSKIFVVIVLSFIFILAGVVNASSIRAGFYVSPFGNDSWSGTLSAPNADSTDGPFRTLSRARNAIRSKLGDMNGDIIVMLRGGKYYLDETVVFGLKDSGQNGFRVIYCNYPGEIPVLSSGVSITGWKKLKDYPFALPEAAKGKVWVADIPPGLGRFYTLYNNERMLPVARSKGFNPIFSTDEVNKKEMDEPFETRTTIHFPRGILRDWKNVEDIELRVIPIPWMMNILPLSRVDVENRLNGTK